MSYGHPALRASFWARVHPEPNTGCWLWSGGTTKGGYGNTKVHYRSLNTHRLAYEVLVGPVPHGLELDHVCRVPACCNPEHLEPVTHMENLRRSPIHPGGGTHCGRGHRFTEADRLPGRKSRRCRACLALRTPPWKRADDPAALAEYRARKSAAQRRYWARKRSLELTTC